MYLDENCGNCRYMVIKRRKVLLNGKEVTASFYACRNEHGMPDRDDGLGEDEACDCWEERDED